MTDVTQGTESDPSTPQQDNVWHFYRGNAIPWYVRMIWAGFWIFTVWYIVRYFFPALQVELVLPP